MARLIRTRSVKGMRFHSHPNPARRFGRLIVTTCQQARTHSLIDQAVCEDAEGRSYKAVAVVRPWRRNEHGEYPTQRALVIGWRST